jgi:hypothetical protein
MMTVNFMPNEVTTYLQCRRGRSTFRRVRIDIGRYQAIYNALPQSALEVVDATGHVWSRGDIKENRGPITLDFQGPPKVTFDPTAFNKAEKAKAADEAKKAARELDKAKQIAEKEAKQISEKMILEKLEDSIADIDISKIGDKNEGTTASKSDQRAEKKDNDNVQQVGGERDTDGETL